MVSGFPHTVTIPPVLQSASVRERGWSKLDLDAGGKLVERASAIRLAIRTLTRKEAMVIVLAERGCDCWVTAEVLGIALHTVENHRSSVRHKMGATRDMAFELLFIPPPIAGMKYGNR
jgi:DNA-binding CsgD family transcriptional regulator